MRLACISGLRKPEARATLRRDVISETMIELSGRFLHLLTQKIKRGDFFTANVVSMHMNIVADSVCWPKSVNDPRNQESFRCDAPKEFLSIIEKFTRLFADLCIVENRWVTTTQLPRVKKRRPIDVFDQIAHCDLPGSARRRRAHLGRWPRCFF